VKYGRPQNTNKANTEKSRIWAEIGLPYSAAQEHGPNTGEEAKAMLHWEAD